MDARSEFNRIFGDVVMSDNDAAWYIFKAGWNAARVLDQYDHPFQCVCVACKQKHMTMTNQTVARGWRKRQIREMED
jgi:hypothetical protein